MHGRYSVLAHYLKVSLKNSRFLKIPKLHPQMCRSILFSSRKGENSTFFLIYYFLFIAIFKNKANSRRNGTSLSSQKAKLSEKHIVSHLEGHPASSP